MLDITVDGIIRQNNECKVNNELANFWNTLSYLVQDGEVYCDSDYRISYVSKFKSDSVKTGIEWRNPRPILMMRKNRVFMLYKKFSKQVGDAALPPESLKFYLENSKEYLGVKNSVRFKNIQKGVEVTKQVERADGKVEYRKTSSTEQAMCFDYEELRKAYNINLEIDAEAQGSEEDNETPPKKVEDKQKQFEF